eukprot:GSA25T00002536001.1
MQEDDVCMATPEAQEDDVCMATPGAEDPENSKDASSPTFRPKPANKQGESGLGEEKAQSNIRVEREQRTHLGVVQPIVLLPEHLTSDMTAPHIGVRPLKSDADSTNSGERTPEQRDLLTVLYMTSRNQRAYTQLMIPSLVQANRQAVLASIEDEVRQSSEDIASYPSGASEQAAAEEKSAASDTEIAVVAQKLHEKLFPHNRPHLHLEDSNSMNFRASPVLKHEVHTWLIQFAGLLAGAENDDVNEKIRSFNAEVEKQKNTHDDGSAKAMIPSSLTLARLFRRQKSIQIPNPATSTSVSTPVIDELLHHALIYSLERASTLPQDGYWYSLVDEAWDTFDLGKAKEGLSSGNEQKEDSAG